MTPVQCHNCSARVPGSAKFCPRCGHAHPAAAAPDAARPGPASPAPVPHAERTPMPVAGLLFVVAAVLGPALVVAGAYTGFPLMLYAGIAVAVGIGVVVLLGQVF